MWPGPKTLVLWNKLGSFGSFRRWCLDGVCGWFGGWIAGFLLGLGRDRRCGLCGMVVVATKQEDISDTRGPDSISCPPHSRLAASHVLNVDG